MITPAELEHLKGPDVVARVTFDRIADPLRAFVRAYLGAKGVSHETVEEVAGLVLASVWQARTSLEIRSEKEWWVWLRLVTRSRWMDYLRTQKGDVDLADFEDELPSGEDAQLEVLLRSSLSEVLGAANALWLGLPPGREVAVVAALLHLADGHSWTDVAPLVRGVQLEDLDQEAVLRGLVFGALYRDGKQVTADVLPCPSEQVEDLARRAQPEIGPPPVGLTWPEVHLVMLRFRNGMLPAQIMRSWAAARCADVEGLFDRCLRRFKFAAIARALHRRLGRHAVAVVTPGVWRRLAFQYGLIDDLPHGYILERINPAAEVFGTTVSLNALTGWLAHRLAKQIYAHMGEESRCP